MLESVGRQPGTFLAERICHSREGFQNFLIPDAPNCPPSAPPAGRTVIRYRIYEHGHLARKALLRVYRLEHQQFGAQWGKGWYSDAVLVEVESGFTGYLSIVVHGQFVDFSDVQAFGVK